MQEYDIAPVSWMISNEEVSFPMYERTKLEELVYELQPSQPRKDFRKYPVTIIHWTDDFDHANDVTQRLMDTELPINIILADIRREEAEAAEKRRSRRSCAPSLKAAENAAMPSASDSTDTNDFAETPQPKRKTSWKKNMAEIYSHVKEDKVVLNIRGHEAIQYVSNAELMRMGRQVVESVEASRVAKAQEQGAERTKEHAEDVENEHQPTTVTTPTAEMEKCANGDVSATGVAGNGLEQPAAPATSDPVDDHCDVQHYDDGLSSESDMDISDCLTSQQRRTESAGKTPGSLKRAVDLIGRQIRKKRQRKLEFEASKTSCASLDPPLPSFPEEESTDQAVTVVPETQGSSVSQDIPCSQRRLLADDDTSSTGTVMNSQASATDSGCSGQSAFEEKLMRYVVAMNERMLQIHSDVKRLKTRAWGGPMDGAPTMRSQLPCGSVDQLRLLEDELVENRAAYNDLVDILTVTGQDCSKGRSVGCFVANMVERVVEKRTLASISWAGTAQKAAFNDFEAVIAVMKCAAQRSFPAGQATDEVVVSKIKRKIGNAGYVHGKSLRSPASRKMGPASNPGTPCSSRQSDAEETISNAELCKESQ